METELLRRCLLFAYATGEPPNLTGPLAAAARKFGIVAAQDQPVRSPTREGDTDEGI